LNYATKVWSPAHISLKCKVENVQWRVTCDQALFYK
jgi:hypothetical protein